MDKKLTNKPPRLETSHPKTNFTMQFKSVIFASALAMAGGAIADEIRFQEWCDTSGTGACNMSNGAYLLNNSPTNPYWTVDSGGGCKLPYTYSTKLPTPGLSTFCYDVNTLSGSFQYWDQPPRCLRWDRKEQRPVNSGTMWEHFWVETPCGGCSGANAASAEKRETKAFQA